MIIKTEQLKPHPKNSFYFDDITGVKWNEFLESIRINGVIEPLIITENYTIVSGHQRLRACLELEISEVPCEIRHYESDDQIEKELIEINVRQRGDIGGSPVKIGRRIRALERFYGIRHGGKHGNQYILARRNNFALAKQTDLAKDFNLTERTLQNYKKLTELIPEMEELVDTGIVNITTAVAIVKELSAAEQEKLVKTLDVTQKYTQKQIQPYINKIKQLEEEKENTPMNVTNHFDQEVKNATELSRFTVQIQNLLEHDLAPIKYKSCIEIVNGDSVAYKNLAEVVDRVESWCSELKKVLNNGEDIIDSEKWEEIK
ncbi:MAG: ParB N-terminal domain-containing protein [Clostridiales bacterium]|nr:ParB N-terminal domain-containing protein [Clostridiales bacterium]